MKNRLLTLTVILALSVLVFVGIANAQFGGVGGPFETLYEDLWYLSDSALHPADSSWEVGSSTSRIAKIWMEEADINTFTAATATITGFVDGNLDMNENTIFNIGATGTDFTTDGGLNLAGELHAYVTATVDGVAYFGSDVNATGSLDVGGTSSFTGVGAFASDLSVGGNLTITGTSSVGSTTFSGDVLPSSPGTYDLGNSTYWWNDMYATTIYGDGSNITGIGTGAPTNLTREAKAGENISKGQCVYVASATGDKPQVFLCDNTAEDKHSMFGLSMDDYTTGQTALIMTMGNLTDVDTDGTGVPGTSESWSAGDCLFMTTGGNLTKTPPTSGVVHKVGIVSKANGNSGIIEIYHHEGHAITVSASSTPYIRMGGDTATSTIEFRNYSNSTVAEIDALGDLSIRNLATSTDVVVGNDLTVSGTTSFATVNTGQGDNELYAMNQDVETSDTVVFAKIGINESNPTTTLDIVGAIRALDSTSTACNATTEGNIIYDSTDKHFYGCNGTSWRELDVGTFE